MTTFPDIHAAVKLALSLVNGGYLPDAVGLQDHMSIKAINHSKLSSIRLTELPTVLLKVSGSQNTVQVLLAIIEESAKANGRDSFEVTLEPGRMEALWHVPKD